MVVYLRPMMLYIWMVVGVCLFWFCWVESVLHDLGYRIYIIGRLMLPGFYFAAAAGLPPPSTHHLHTFAKNCDCRRQIWFLLRVCYTSLLQYKVYYLLCQVSYICLCKCCKICVGYNNCRRLIVSCYHSIWL